MAFIKATIDRVAWTGKRTYGGQDSYTVQYTISSDDRDDGPQQVIDAFQSGTIAGEAVPRLGDLYSFGNDNDPFLYNSSIDAQRVGDSGGHPDVAGEEQHFFRVPLTFSPIYTNETQEKETPDGSNEATTNPLEFRREFDISFNLRTEDAQRLPFAGVFWSQASSTYQNVPFDLGAVRRTKNVDLAANPLVLSGDLGQPANSAGEAVDPPYQIQKAHAVGKLERRR